MHKIFLPILISYKFIIYKKRKKTFTILMYEIICFQGRHEMWENEF